MSTSLGIRSDDESSASEEMSPPNYPPKPAMRRRMSIRELQSQGKSTKEALLQILNKKLKPYNIIVNNLKSDWVDGKALAALINSQMPAFNMESDESDNGSLLRRCISTAETHLNIPAFIDAADVEAGVLDDVCMMTYLSNFFKKVNKGPSLEIVDEEASKSDKSEDDSLGEATSSSMHTVSNLDKQPAVDMAETSVKVLDDVTNDVENGGNSKKPSSSASTSSSSSPSSSSSSLLSSENINEKSKGQNFDRSNSNSSEEKQSKSSGLFFSSSDSRSTSQSPESSAAPVSSPADLTHDTKVTSPDLDTSLQFSEALPTNSLLDLRSPPTNSLLDLRSLPEESSRSEYPLFSLRRPGLMYTPEALALLDCGKRGGVHIPDTDSELPSEHHDVTYSVDTEREMKSSGLLNKASSGDACEVPSKEISSAEGVINEGKVDDNDTDSPSTGRSETEADSSADNPALNVRKRAHLRESIDVKGKSCSDNPSAENNHRQELLSRASNISEQAETPQNLANANIESMLVDSSRDKAGIPSQCTAGFESEATEKPLIEDLEKPTIGSTGQDSNTEDSGRRVYNSEIVAEEDRKVLSIDSNEINVEDNGDLEEVHRENSSGSQSLDSSLVVNGNPHKSSLNADTSLQDEPPNKNKANVQDESLNKNDTSSESSKKTDQFSDRLLDKTWSVTCGEEVSYDRPASKNLMKTQPFAGKYTSYHDLRNVGRGDKRLSLPEFFLNKSRQHLAPSTASLNRTSYYSTDLFEQHFISENHLECEFLDSSCHLNSDTKSSSDAAYNDSNTSENVGSIFGLETDKSLPPTKPPRSRNASDLNNKRGSSAGIEMLMNEVAKKFNLPSNTDFIMSDSGNVDQLRNRQQVQTPNTVVKNTASLPDLTMTSEELESGFSEQSGLEYDMFDPQLSVSGFEVAKTETLPTSFEFDEITNIDEKVKDNSSMKRDGPGEVENVTSAKSPSDDNRNVFIGGCLEDQISAKYPSDDNRNVFIGGCLEDQIGEKSASRTSVRFNLSNLGIDDNVGSSQDTSFDSSQGENRDFLFGFIENSDSENSKTLLQEVNDVVSKQNLLAKEWENSWVDGKVLLALVDSKIPGIYQRHKHSSSYVAVSEALEVVKKHLKIIPNVTPSDILFQEFNQNDLMELARDILSTSRFQHISNVETVESKEAAQLNSLLGKLAEQDEKISYLKQLNQVLARRGKTVENLSSEWSNGNMLLSLVDTFVSGVQTDGENLPTMDKVLFGLKMAHRYLNIKPIISAEELVHGHFPDQVAAYLLQFRSLCEEVTGPVVKRRPKKNPPLPPRTKHRNSKTQERCDVSPGNRSGMVGSTDYEQMTKSGDIELPSTALRGLTLSNPDTPSPNATGLTEDEAKLLMDKLLKQFHQFLVKQESDSNPKNSTTTPVSNLYENCGNPTNKSSNSPAKEALYSVNDKTIFISCDLPHPTINKVLRTLYDRFDSKTQADFSGPICFKADKYCFCNKPVIAPEDGAAVLKMTVMSDCECEHVKIKPVLTVGRDRLVHDRFRSSFVLLTDFEGGISGTSSESEKEHYCRMNEAVSQAQAVSEKSKSRLSSLFSKIKRPFRRKVKRLNHRSISTDSGSSSTTKEFKRKSNDAKNKRDVGKIKEMCKDSGSKMSDKHSKAFKNKADSDTIKVPSIGATPTKSISVQVNFSKGQKGKTTRSTQTPFEDTTWNNTTAHVEPIKTEPGTSGENFGRVSGENQLGHNHTGEPVSDSGRIFYQNCTFNTYSCCKECQKHSHSITTDHTLLSSDLRLHYPPLSEKQDVISLSRPYTPRPTWDHELRASPTYSPHHCYNRFCSRSPSLYKTEQIDTIYHGISSLPHDNLSPDAPTVFSKTDILISTPFSSSGKEDSEADADEDDDKSIFSTEDEEKDFSTEKEVSLNSPPQTPSTTKHSPDLSTIENLVEEVVSKVESYDKSSTEREPDITSLKHVVEIVLEPDLAPIPSAVSSRNFSKNLHATVARSQNVKSVETQITPSLSLSESGELLTKTLSITETQYSTTESCRHHYRNKNKDNAINNNNDSTKNALRTASSSACTLLASTRAGNNGSSFKGSGKGVSARRHVALNCNSTKRNAARSSLMDSNVFSTLLKEKKKSFSRGSCAKRCEKCNRPKKVRIASSAL